MADEITATCDVSGTTFARFGQSGWYRRTGVSWGALPSPLYVEPMLDTIVARNAEIERLRGGVDFDSFLNVDGCPDGALYDVNGECVWSGGGVLFAARTEEENR